MYLNRARSEFGNPLVARAMEYAIDRDAICENIYFGFCEPTFKPFPDDYWAGSPDIADDYYTYDPEKAKELLAEAGLADGFSFELMIPAASDPYPQFAEVLQAQLAAVGITVNDQPGRHQPAGHDLLRRAAVRRPARRRRPGPGAGPAVLQHLEVDVVRQRRRRDVAGHGRADRPDERRARPGRAGRDRA